MVHKALYNHKCTVCSEWKQCGSMRTASDREKHVCLIQSLLLTLREMKTFNLEGLGSRSTQCARQDGKSNASIPILILFQLHDVFSHKLLGLFMSPWSHCRYIICKVSKFWEIAKMTHQMYASPSPTHLPNGLGKTSVPNPQIVELPSFPSDSDNSQN